jgi:hypothetical protein
MSLTNILYQEIINSRTEFETFCIALFQAECYDSLSSLHSNLRQMYQKYDREKDLFDTLENRRTNRYLYTIPNFDSLFPIDSLISRIQPTIINMATIMNHLKVNESQIDSISLYEVRSIYEQLIKHLKKYNYHLENLQNIGECLEYPRFNL